MTAPLSSFSGIASGFNYSTLVDAIIQQESLPLTTMQKQKSDLATRDQALGTYRGMLANLQTAAQSLRDGSALQHSVASIGLVAGTSTLATASTSGTVEPGTHLLQVSQLAQAQKLGGTTVADATSALGITGTFTVNGVSISTTGTDSLNAIRDRINAANSGATPSGVSASVIAVSPTDQRLVLTSAATGSAGIALADTTGTGLQSLGFLDASDVLRPAAVLVAGRDALFKLDTIDFVRSTNVVADAIPGLSLTLTKADATSTNQVLVAGDVNAATAAAQGFAAAYNALVGFMKQQQTVPANGTPPPLYNSPILRTMRASLPRELLQTVPGAAADLNTAASVGISLQADGTVAFAASTFSSAFQNRFADVAQLFTERLAAADPEVSFVSGGAGTASGSWPVAITAPATRAAVTTTGFSGTYDDGGTPDTLRVTDNGNGHSANVVLTTGMTTADIVQALQAAFTTAGVNITPTASGNDIALTHTGFGSHAGITVTVTGAGDGASEAWTSPATVYGTDVTGTIGGFAATGSGQLLVGNNGSEVAGMSARYTGTSARAAGSISMQLGVGAVVQRSLNTFLATGSGSLDIATRLDADKNNALDIRIDAVQGRLALRRAALMKQFAQMETAIAGLQSQSQALFGVTNALTSAVGASGTKSK